MCEFIIYYRNGREKRYQVSFSPYPSWSMLEALADTIIMSKGEQLYQIITSNGMDALYIISTPEAVDDDARAAMRAKFGRRGPAMIERLDDVTECI